MTTFVQNMIVRLMIVLIAFVPTTFVQTTCDLTTFIPTTFAQGLVLNMIVREIVALKHLLYHICSKHDC
jgi:hypothetical protein